jgi:predicted enzyme related to lactoylglutathione lyase
MSNDIKYVHTNLIARDWKSLAQFYIDVFGCVTVPPERHLSGEWIDRMTGIAGVRVDGVHLALPGYEHGPTLEIFSYYPAAFTARPEINRPGFGHIAFHVDDVRSVVNQVMEHGGALLGEIIVKEYETLGRLTAAYTKDPEGNIIEIQNWGKGMA